MDNRTRAAVRRFQKPQGLDSGILSLAAARKLGLVAIKLDETSG
jgi:peptidoglycan hydrolase-like protein with peptidoglycan-binding domain